MSTERARSENARRTKLQATRRARSGFPPAHLGLAVTLVPGDGNCFFTAMYHALMTAGPTVRAEMEGRILRHMRRVDIGNILAEDGPAGTFVGVDLSPHLLREVVASAYLLPDAMRDAMAATCAALHEALAEGEGDASVAQDMEHMRHVVGEAGTLPFRHTLYMTMANPAVYWADDMAIMALETVLNAKVAILDRTASRQLVSLTFGVDHGALWAPDYVFTVVQRGRHYDHARINGMSCFPIAEVPPQLQDLAQSCLPNAVHEYMRLLPPETP